MRRLAGDGNRSSTSAEDDLAENLATGLPSRLMGFLSRLFVPRGVRRAMHPGRAVKRAVTPKPIKQMRHAMHPIDT